MEVVVTTANWSYKSHKAQIITTQQTNNQSSFYRPDAIPVAQPTVSNHWRENITFHGRGLSQVHLVVLVCDH